MSKVNNGNDELAAAIREVAKSIAMFAEVMADRPRPELYAAAEQVATVVTAAVLKPSANDVKKATPPISEPEKEAAALPLTYEKDIKPIAQRVLVEKGREALLHLLEGFQVKSATKLNADQFDRFIETAQAVLS